jgi:hypothetical protein
VKPERLKSERRAVCCILTSCNKIANAEAAVSVNENKWFVMHMHVQLKLDELWGPTHEVSCTYLFLGCCITVSIANLCCCLFGVVLQGCWLAPLRVRWASAKQRKQECWGAAGGGMEGPCSHGELKQLHLNVYKSVSA